MSRDDNQVGVSWCAFLIGISRHSSSKEECLSWARLVRCIVLYQERFKAVKYPDQLCKPDQDTSQAHTPSRH